MTILVTGATGTIGNQVARKLLSAGHSIRVSSRHPEALQELVGGAAPGKAEAVRLDLEDPLTFEAFAGVDILFLVGPTGQDISVRVATAIAAAEKAGVKHVVRYSALGADANSTFDIAREQGLADAALERSGMMWTILKPTFYQDNFINFQGEAIKGTNAFYGSSGDGKVAYVSSDDIAAVAAKVLADPSQHEGKHYRLTGPEAVDDRSVAATLSGILGRTIEYVDLGDDGLRTSLIERGTPAWFANALVGLEQVKRNGGAAELSPSVEQVLARAPEPINTFLQRNVDRLR